MWRILRVEEGKGVIVPTITIHRRMPPTVDTVINLWTLEMWILVVTMPCISPPHTILSTINLTIGRCKHNSGKLCKLIQRIMHQMEILPYNRQDKLQYRLFRFHLTSKIIIHPHLPRQLPGTKPLDHRINILLLLKNKWIHP